MSFDRFANRDNFYLAFKKLAAHFRQSNEWYDPVEFSTYEANLTNNIARLIELIGKEKYKPHEIQPLPFPKRAEDHQEKLRQYFKISIDDQLIWIAITNVIGEFVESKMPVWNYGNRLYQPIWFEKDDKGFQKLKKGNHSNTSEHYYRKWTQSWPIYRKHISMTIKIMGRNSKFNPFDFDDESEVALYDQEMSRKEHYYLDNNFWPVDNNTKLYWAGLDFKAFFPTVNPQIVIENLNTILKDPTTHEIRPEIKTAYDTLTKMFKYPINISGWEKHKKDLKHADKCNLPNTRFYNGIPTGLLSSGFLANVAMIEVDHAIDNYVQNKKNIVVFKYVDDHVILSKTQEGLVDFLNYYHKLLKDSRTDIKFQRTKVLPKGKFDFSEDKGFKEDESSKVSNEVDIDFPKPLMTQTLQKMSKLNSEEFDLSDSEELDRGAADLEHFLLADFPDEEIRRDTRMSFAAAKLCQIADKMIPSHKILDSLLINYLISKKKEDEAKKEKNKNQLNQIIAARKEGEKKIRKEVVKQDEAIKRKQFRILQLILSSINENPDKLKLWKRCIQLCQSTGISGLEKIFIHLNDAKLEEKSKAYIFAYCLLTLNESLLKGHNTLKSQNKSFWKTNNTILFFKDFYTLDILARQPKFNFPFLKETVANHIFIRQFILDTKYTSLDFGNAPPRRKGFSIGQKNFRRLKIGKLTKLQFENQLWNLLSYLNRTEKFELWKSQISNLDLNRPISWSILSLFPNHITHLVFRKIQEVKPKDNAPTISFEQKDFFSDGSGILYEIFANNPKYQKYHLQLYPIIKTCIKYRNSEFVTLDEWIKTVVSQSSNKKWTDSRLSEWSLLEIIRQISKEISNEIYVANKDFFGDLSPLYKVHPANYLVHRNWLKESNYDLQWQTWKETMGKHPIKLKDRNEFLDDFRYFPVRDLWRSNYAWIHNKEFSIVIALSVLMIKLLCKSFHWPPITNKMTFIDNIFSQAIVAIEQQPVSSDTRILLAEVFSKSDINFMWGYSLTDIITGRIITLENFIERILVIQENLVSHQLALIDQSPRQLTFIDIDKLNESKNKF